ESERSAFFSDAARVVTALGSNDFPGFAHMEIRAVFKESATPLGSARNLGQPIPERDSFLGLYFPYWRNFGRWYHVVYPTREERYRAAIGLVAHDYPIALVRSSDYWGVGN